MSDRYVLKVADLNVFYKNRKRKLFSGKNKKIQALYDVSVSMEEGEVPVNQEAANPLLQGR